MCSLQLCGAWKPIDEAATPMLGDTNVQCRRMEASSICLTPLTTRMVQVGEKSLETMFDMKPFTDHDDFLVRRWANNRAAHDKWGDRDLLVKRQVNIRLYQNEARTALSACAIINTYGMTDDQIEHSLLLYTMTSQVRGVEGQALTFITCDDFNSGSEPMGSECRNATKPANTLHASFKGIEKHTDGWCIGPLRDNGETIEIKLTGMNGLNGVNFQNPDGSKHEFTFAADQDKGFKGTIDPTTSMVVGGEAPTILIRPSGIFL